MHAQSDETPLFCDRCTVELHPGRGDFFVIKIEAVADPTPPEFTEEDLKRDHKDEIRRLLAQTEEMSEREAMDQVHRRLTVFLCNSCYGHWIEDPTH
jgi:hypothetical protein